MGRKKRKCPYCKSKVSYFGALSELNSGEHTCRNCYKNSNIAYNKMIYIPAVIALVIAIIVAAMFFVFKIIKNLILALILILVPFAVFYFITPLFFTLEEIKNEAQTPVMFEPKRAARSEKQSRALKSDEIAKSNNVKKEQKSSEKKKSGGGKFAQFVRTYIIVPDDDEENNIKSDDKKSEPKIEHKFDDNTDFVIINEDEDVIFDAAETEDISQRSNNENFVDISSGSTSSYENSKNDVRKKQEKSADKPKLNFNKLFSKLIFSDEEDSDMPANNITPEIEMKSDDIVSLAGPVYHRLTKTNKVNFIYYPEKKAIISVDLNVADKKAEENKNESESAENVAEQENNNDVTESIEMVVEKAIEAEKNEEENREIVDFFAKESPELNEEQIDEENTAESQSDNVSEEFIEDDWVEYKPETGDFITLDFKVPESKVSSNDIIELSDVNFDIPDSEDIYNMTAETEDDFIDYDIENKLPFIVVEDSAATLSEIDRRIFEKNPTKYEWNVFSAENINFKPETVDFNNNLIDNVVDDEIDYKAEYEIFSQSVTEDNSNDKSVDEDSKKSESNHAEIKDKHKLGLFSKYVSKIKNESVFNFSKSVDYEEKTDENPTEILEFKEALPEEVEVDEVIEFDSVSDVDENKENFSIITTDDYIKDNADENEFDSGEIAEPKAEEEFNDNFDIEELIEEQNNNELLKNKEELEIEKNFVEEIEKAEVSELTADYEDVTASEVEDFVEEDEISESETTFDMDYESVADEVVNAEIESTEIAESNSVNDELEIFNFSDFEEQEKDVEEDDDYYIFDEEDDEEVSEEDDDYYIFDEEDDEEVSEEDDDYYRFDEEEDENPEKDDDYYKFDEEDDEVYEEELSEGHIIPEEENDDNYVVDYSSDKNDDFEDISSGEQLDEDFNLEEFRAMSIEEDAAQKEIPAEPVIAVKIDSSGNVINDSAKTSRYEKKFPNAAKAAAEQAVSLETKNHKEQQKAKNKKSSGETVKKNSQKTKEVRKKDSPKKNLPKKDSQKKEPAKRENLNKEPQKAKKTQKVQEQKTGFFSGLKNKIIEATEEERQAVFEEEERERKLAEKEARRKAKEKEKEKAEKLKDREEKEKNRAAVGVNTAKDSYEKLERQAKADAEERKKKSQKTKRIEKNKVKIPSNVPADGKTLVFDGSEKTNTKEFKAQEKIVLDSVKDKVKELENKKVTEAEKVKIISEKVDEEKRLEEIEKLKSEQEEQRVKKEKKRRERQLQNERLEKAEEIRREQVKQVRRSQNERKKSEEKRDTNNVSLKEVDNVRSKVSQKKKKRKQEINEVL